MWLFRSAVPPAVDDGASAPLLEGEDDWDYDPSHVSSNASPRTTPLQQPAPSPSAPSLDAIMIADAPSAPRLSDVASVASVGSTRGGAVGSTGGGAVKSKLHRASSGRSSMSISSIKDLVDEYYSEGSIRGSIFNLCSATLGAGALSVPYAFKGMGIGTGTVLLVLVAVMTSFSVHLIIITRMRSGLRSFGDIADGVFGNTVGAILQLAVVIFCFGTSVAYCKTLRDILESVLAAAPRDFSSKVTDQEAMIALWVVALMPLSLLKSMSSLRFSSLFGVGSIVYVTVCITVHSLKNLISGKVKPVWTDAKLWAVPSFGQVTMSLPILLFAFTCQVNVLDVWDDLTSASKRRMQKVTHRSMSLCLAIYVSVGLFGFLDFGTNTCGNILKSYQSELLKGSAMIIGMYFCIALTLLFAFPLVVVPCRGALQGLCERLCGSSGSHTVWSLLVAGGALAVSLWVEDVSQVFQLVGASSSALVCFVFPPMAALKLGVVKGREYWISWALMIGGIVVAILGTVVTVNDMYHPSKETKKCV